MFSFKYKPYLTDIKSVFIDLFYESLIQNEYFSKLTTQDKWILVPIPLSKTKLRKRGYNQAEILAKELAKRFNLQSQNVLKRVKDTKTQVGKSSVDRKLNIKGAFVISPSASSGFRKNCSILLIDDVVTTGSTLKEAANVLKRAGAKKVIGLTLARD